MIWLADHGSRLSLSEPVDALGLASRSQKPVPSTLRVSGPSHSSSSAQPVLPPPSATTSKPIVRAGSAALRAETVTSKPKQKKRKRQEDEDLFNDMGMRTGTPTTKGHGHKEHKSKKAKHDDHDLRVCTLTCLCYVPTAHSDILAFR